ncbi:MAG: hypothetical protein KBT12_07000 [Bacteroidales bacterium]|nr:hypothetical protein [Candidatus Physcousia equi]
MKKITLITAAAIMCSGSAMAGGLLTNTNQNAAFLRNFAQEGQITLTSLYANPAGNAFLSPGWHLSLNSQTAFQNRDIATTFPLFSFNAENRNTTHNFKGEATAPVVPSISLSHNWDRWSLSAHFALTGGGGKCEFDKGLGTFESLYAGKIYTGVVSSIADQFGQQYGASYLPFAIANYMGQGMSLAEAQAKAMNEVKQTAIAYGRENAPKLLQGYNLGAFMRGRSYYFGLQIGGAYKIKENVSAYLGVRGLYANCNYFGYVQDVQYTVMGHTANATQTITTAQGEKEVNADLSLNCDQTGFGITPIIGLDWEINKHWNVAAKYEAPTRMSLKNKTEMNEYTNHLATPVLADGTVNEDYQPTLGQFADGGKVREDVPAILALGAEYRLNEKVRFDGAFKTYFDKSARKYGNKEDLIDHNTWEVALGAEYDCHKLITVSASWMRTCYGLNDAYMNDLSFNLSSHSLGLGVRIHPSKYFNIDLGYMQTFYQDRTVTQATLAGDKVDTYSRKNKVFGIGFNVAL